MYFPVLFRDTAIRVTYDMVRAAHRWDTPIDRRLKKPAVFHGFKPFDEVMTQFKPFEICEAILVTTPGKPRYPDTFKRTFGRFVKVYLWYRDNPRAELTPRQLALLLRLEHSFERQFDIQYHVGIWRKHINRMDDPFLTSFESW